MKWTTAGLTTINGVKVHCWFDQDSSPCRCNSGYSCLRHRHFQSLHIDYPYPHEQASSIFSAAVGSHQSPPSLEDDWTPQEATENFRSFPTKRRIERRSRDTTKNLAFLESWVQEKKITIGPLVPEEDKLELFQWLWTYRDLEATGILDMGPPTDLILHRATIKPGTAPYKPKPKRLAPDKEWWLRKYAMDGLQSGLFERTTVANGRLSEWGSDPVLVKKPGKDEPRLTFNHHYVWEVKPANQMEAAERTHEFLCASSHTVFSAWDLKNAYWAASIHPDDRKYFAFHVPGIGQLQPTRMSQGSRTSSFTMNELCYIAFGEIPPPCKEPSLIVPTKSRLQHAGVYIDDIFPAHSTWKEHFAFTINHLLPRLLWAKFKISWSKIKIGVNEVVALGQIHVVGGQLLIHQDRVKKITDFPPILDQGAVRGFLGVTATTRKWIKGYSEIARPLSMLTGKNTPWQWTSAQDAAVELLKMKCATAGARFGWVKHLPVEMFLDASGFAMGCYICQRVGKEMRPLFYDSQTFTPTERNYDTYKRELKAIVTFTKKHRHMLNAEEASTIWTDHKPLVTFMDSHNHEDIFARWVNQLRLYNLKIKHIQGKRNLAADGLSRTIWNADCTETKLTRELNAKLDEHRDPNSWFWKSGKGGYDEWLRNMNDAQRKQAVSAIDVMANLRSRTADQSDEAGKARLEQQKKKAARRVQQAQDRKTRASSTVERSANPRLPAQLRDTEGQEQSTQQLSKNGNAGDDTAVTEQPPLQRTPRGEVHSPHRSGGEGIPQPEEPQVQTPSKSQLGLPEGVINDANTMLRRKDEHFESLRDQWYTHIINTLRDGKLPEGIPRSEKARIDRILQSFRLKGDTLQRKVIMDAQETTKWVPCLDPHLVAPVLQAVHDKAGHFSDASAIVEKIKHRMFWPSMIQDVHLYLKGCINCARITNHRKSKHYHPIHSLRPWQIVVLDLMGKLPTTTAGHDHILVVVDYFTRFTITRALRSTTNIAVIAALGEIFNAYTRPLFVYFDMGPQLNSEGLRSWLTSKGISYDYVPVSGKRPAGLVEGTIKHLRNTLIAGRAIPLEKAQQVEDKGKNVDFYEDNDWHSRLGQVTHSLNHKVMKAFGYSRAELALYATPGEMLDLELQFPGPNQETVALMTTGHINWAEEPSPEHLNSVSCYMDKRQTLQSFVIKDQTEARMARAKKMSSWLLNRKVKTGDTVLLYRVFTAGNPKNQFRSAWRGPFIVGPPTGSHGMTWVILTGKGNRYTTAHIDDLRPIPPKPPHLRTEHDSVIFPEKLVGWRDTKEKREWPDTVQTNKESQIDQATVCDNTIFPGKYPKILDNNTSKSKLFTNSNAPNHNDMSQQHQVDVNNLDSEEKQYDAPTAASTTMPDGETTNAMTRQVYTKVSSTALERYDHLHSTDDYDRTLLRPLMIESLAIMGRNGRIPDEVYSGVERLIDKNFPTQDQETRDAQDHDMGVNTLTLDSEVFPSVELHDEDDITGWNPDSNEVRTQLFAGGPRQDNEDHHLEVNNSDFTVAMRTKIRDNQVANLSPINGNSPVILPKYRIQRRDFHQTLVLQCDTNGQREMLSKIWIAETNAELRRRSFIIQTAKREKTATTPVDLGPYQRCSSIDLNDKPRDPSKPHRLWTIRQKIFTWYTHMKYARIRAKTGKCFNCHHYGKGRECNHPDPKPDLTPPYSLTEEQAASLHYAMVEGPYYLRMLKDEKMREEELTQWRRVRRWENCRYKRMDESLYQDLALTSEQANDLKAQWINIYKLWVDEDDEHEDYDTNLVGLVFAPLPRLPPTRRQPTSEVTRQRRSAAAKGRKKPKHVVEALQKGHTNWRETRPEDVSRAAKQAAKTYTARTGKAPIGFMSVTKHEKNDNQVEAAHAGNIDDDEMDDTEMDDVERGDD